MSAVPDSSCFSESELIETIAAELPPHLQAAYYRELMHCRALPQDDEMLHIIHILQLLTYPIYKAPAMLATERQHIETRLVSFTEALEHAVRSLHDYRQHFDTRLAELPEDIAKRIQADRIAAAICESVRQEFARTGLLEIGSQFQATYTSLERLFARSNGAIENLEATENVAAERITAGAKRFVGAMDRTSESFSRYAERITSKTSWQQDALIAIVITVVFLLGMKIDHRLFFSPPPAEQSVAPVAQQPAPAAVQPKQQQRKR